MTPEVTLDSDSLPEEAHSALGNTNRSITVPSGKGFWRRLLAFSGPAFLVSVGYMDPGNWATDIEGGSRFRYQLLWVILASNLIAMLLQTLAARLGLVTGRDLAQTCRTHYKKPAVIALWLGAELAIAACDLAEVLGSAIALNLLFHIPLFWATLITALDVLLLLALQNYGMRLIEAIIVTLVATIAGCYVLEIFLAKPDLHGIVHGLTTPVLNQGNLFIALGILGATVMPHNLYLHSALVLSRKVKREPAALRTAMKFNLLETVIALNGAFFVNAAILIMAAAVFFERGLVVTEMQQAHSTLNHVFSTGVASTVFALALLAAGQSSTITGTLAGQIIMEGFLHLRVRPWLRRLLTRSLAIVPALLIIGLRSRGGEAAQNHAAYDLLLFSQVILSMQLSFATIPLVLFTGNRDIMGEFVNPLWVRLLAWPVVLTIAALNVYLLRVQFTEWLGSSSRAVGLLLLIAGLILAFALFVRHWKTSPKPLTVG